MNNNEKPDKFVYQDFMEQLQVGHEEVMVHLNNGIKLTGYVVRYDGKWIELESPQYKSSNCIINITNVTSVSYK